MTRSGSTRRGGKRDRRPLRRLPTSTFLVLFSTLHNGAIANALRPIPCSKHCSAPNVINRRQWGSQTVASSVVGTVVLLPDVVRAATTNTALTPNRMEDSTEAIRRVASKTIPGLGPPDVYYPPFFQGVWTVHRQIVFNPNNATVMDGSNTSNIQDIEYLVRFLALNTHPDNSLESDEVVSDRGYNQANLEVALQLQPDEKWVQSYQWKASNPNDLRLEFRNGSTQDIKVTKRATERTNTTVFSSEFQRLVQQGNELQAIPSIAAHRVLTKWKVVNDNRIEGLELVYNMGGSAFGDPLAASPSSQSSPQQPVLISKSRLLLERVSLK